jgi:hypothetical protein
MDMGLSAVSSMQYYSQYFDRGDHEFIKTNTQRVEDSYPSKYVAIFSNGNPSFDCRGTSIREAGRYLVSDDYTVKEEHVNDVLLRITLSRGDLFDVNASRVEGSRVEVIGGVISRYRRDESGRIGYQVNWKMLSGYCYREIYSNVFKDELYDFIESFLPKSILLEVV